MPDYGRYGRGYGYAEITARRAWQLAGLNCQEDLFNLSDEELLALPGVGAKALQAIRKLQQQAEG